MIKQYKELTNGAGKYEQWVRLPTKPGERLQGLSRATIYLLINEGRVKSACLKKPGNLTGIRLIWLKSLMDYLERCVVVPDKQD